MPHNQFTVKQQIMLQKAHKVIEEASVGFTDILAQHILDINAALKAGQIKEAHVIANTIHSQAGTFGWDLMTEVAGWFKRILATQINNGPNIAVNKIFLDSFSVILKEELKKESKAAITLLDHIEDLLKKENLR